jgi:hypothetical protein
VTSTGSGYLTDRQHLLKVREQLRRDLDTLALAWVDEDEGACAPAAGGIASAVSGGGASDPTLTSADHHAKYRGRDRIGRTLLHLAGKVREEAARLETRTPSRPCTCCGLELATHGEACFECDRYARVHREWCGDNVHKARPRVRMCSCPPERCEVCPDRAEEGRTVSHRCKARMQRARAAARALA